MTKKKTCLNIWLFKQNMLCRKRQKRLEITILIIGHTPSYTQTLTLCIKMLPAGKYYQQHWLFSLLITQVRTTSQAYFLTSHFDTIRFPSEKREEIIELQKKRQNHLFDYPSFTYVTFPHIFHDLNFSPFYVIFLSNGPMN